MANTSVGIRDLKNNLSRYVARARAGEVISVTDHGEEVALLVPSAASRRSNAALWTAVADGKITWDGSGPDWPEYTVSDRGHPVVDDVIAERADRLS